MKWNWRNLDIDAFEAAIGFEPIRQQGDEDIGHCPDPWGLHKNGDTTGKFAINRVKKITNCWVCGGNHLVGLVQAIKDYDEQEAIHFLQQFVVEQSTESFVEEIDGLLAEDRFDKRTLPRFNENVLLAWEKDHSWFQDRGISPETRQFFRLGYNPQALYKQYQGRAIVLPHFFQGHLVGWQHRWLDDSRPASVKKYTNTRDFPRKETLWGYDFCCAHRKAPVVVESVPTALYLISEGIPSIATFGASVTSAQIELLRVFDCIAISADNDAPGIAARDRITKELDRIVLISHIPLVEGEGADLGDVPPDRLHQMLKDTYVAGLPGL